MVSIGVKNMFNIGGMGLLKENQGVVPFHTPCYSNSAMQTDQFYGEDPRME
jgi:hypothetical protein